MLPSGNHVRVAVVVKSNQGRERLDTVPKRPSGGIHCQFLAKRSVKCGHGPAGLFRQPRDKLGLLPARFQFSQWDLRFLWSSQAEDGFAGAFCRVVEQALINMTNLFNVQGPKTDPSRLRAASRNLHLQKLERFQKMKNGSVVDGNRLSPRVAPGGISPGGSVRSAFEERVTVRVKQVPAIRWQRELVVIRTSVNRPERCQQPRERIVPVFQHLLAMRIRVFPKAGVHGGDGVVVAIDRIRNRQKVALFGEEQEHQAHH